LGSLLTRILCSWRSLRTMILVILVGQYPLGKTLFLHIGQRDELFKRNVSTQSGWKICRQGSSRTCVSFASKSSRQMGHVGCENAEKGALGMPMSGAEERRVCGVTLRPVSCSIACDGRICARVDGCSFDFSESRVVGAEAKVYNGNFSRYGRGTVNRLTPSLSKSISPLTTRWRKLLRRLRCMTCMNIEVDMITSISMPRTMTRNTQRLGS
jgi:hypothetical protein